MDESDTVDMMLKIVNQANRTRYDTYTRAHVPIFDDVMDLRMFLLEHYADELSSPADANSFRKQQFQSRRDIFFSEKWSNSFVGRAKHSNERQS